MKLSTRKVAIVGAGQVGATTAYTLMISGLVSDLVLIDINHLKASGEALDLSHGMAFCPPTDVVCGDYSACKGADIVILTAGANQKPGETRLDLTRKNVNVFGSIVPEVVRHAPNAILLVVTNPVDILTYVTLKISGLPASRVIGSGTVLDTARLRYLLSRHTDLDPRNIHSYVIGEHGDSELPLWSLTRIAGMDMDRYCASCGGCGGKLSQVAKDSFDSQVRNVAYSIIEKKGATYYAVALAVRRITEAILRDERSILTVSSLLTGQYGLRDLCLSLPCIVGAQGVDRVLPVNISEEEHALLLRSGDTIANILAQINQTDLASIPV